MRVNVIIIHIYHCKFEIKSKRFPKENINKVSERDYIMASQHKVSSKESEEMRRLLAKNESPGTFVSKLYYVKKSIEPIIDEIITNAITTVKKYHDSPSLGSVTSNVEQNDMEQNTEDVDQNVEFEEDIPEESDRPSRHFSSIPRKTPYPAELKNLLKSKPKEGDESSESPGETPAEFASYMIPQSQQEEVSPIQKESATKSRNLVFDKSLDDQEEAGQRELTEAELIRRVNELTDMLVGPLGDAAKNNPVLINELSNLLQRLGYRMDAIMEKTPDLDYSQEMSPAPPTMMPLSQMGSGAVRGCGEAACSYQVCAERQPIMESCSRYQVPKRHPSCVTTMCSTTAGTPLAPPSRQSPIAHGFAVPQEPPRGASRTRPPSQERRPMIASSTYAGQASLQGPVSGQVPSRGCNSRERGNASEEQLMNPICDDFPEQSQRVMSKCCALSPCFKPTCKQTYCREPRKKDSMPP